MRTMSDIEKRASQRIQVEIPVYVGHKEAFARDISWDGIYFLTDQVFTEGGGVNFSLELDYAMPGKPIKVGCEGKVVRVERHGEKFGIAAKINSFQYFH
jgi:hypothetical protein